MSLIEPWKKIKFKRFSDGRGDLVPLEFGEAFPKSDIPFEVKRCYYITAPTNDDGAIRGRHAHKKLNQVIICLTGFFTLTLEAVNGKRADFFLNDNTTGIIIADHTPVWRELSNFSPNCVIIVLASEHYNPDDYINDYNTFRGLN